LQSTENIFARSFCAITLESGADCGSPVPEGATINLCAEHYVEAYEWWVHNGPRRKAEQDEASRCPACGLTALHPGETGQACIHCGYETPNFTGGDLLEVSATTSRFRTTASRPAHTVPVVYYLQFGDRIKIGTSTNFRSRIKAIPHDRILAIEKGTRSLEQARHKQFETDHVTGEWFSPSPALLDHIKSIRPRDGRWSRQLAEWELS
jgi:hypothetical protein